MKIFVDGYLLNKEFQGTRTYITELYKSIAKLDPQIEIVFGVNDVTNEIENEFSQYQNISFYVFQQKNKWIRMFTEYSKLSNLFDYMHFQYIIPFVKKNKKCKYINTVHDVLFIDYPADFPFFYRLSRTILFKYSAKKADLLFTVSDYSKERIAYHFGIDSSKIYITPNGVNTTFFENFDKELAKKYVADKFYIDDYILYVSRIEPRKNQVQLLQLYADSDKVNRSKKLVFIGKNSLESASFNQYLEGLSPRLRERIFYIEQVSNSDLEAFYKGADFFIYPSLCEGFGIPPIEAASFNVPVLINAKTAMRDFTMFSPYLVDFDQENILEIFNAFIKDKQRDLAKVKTEIENKYTWETSAKKVLNLL